MITYKLAFAQSQHPIIQVIDYTLIVSGHYYGSALLVDLTEYIHKLIGSIGV